MDSGEDHHRIVVLHTVNLAGHFTRINVCNLLVHVEEVAVTLEDNVNTEAVDRLREVEEHGQASVVNAIALVAALLGCT